ncbi:MAG TPA: hypothetical protein PKC11_08845 [Agitococcus sp.]|nr:hypothetical protein [Agitococcus sp.]HMV61522.1 hypothetical protein [Agitococcus sp.]HNC85702.1 hypothetical protein [Agitococcus sp.]
MKKPTSVNTLETLGRVRLSESFFMRDFLYSEISQIENIANIPDDPDLAIFVGKKLCENVLEPIQAALGRISIRSAYRSCAVNAKGAENNNQYRCSKNESNYARHIWDKKDADGCMGATACIIVNSFIPYYERTTDWAALAWWIHDHIASYSEMQFFPKFAAFNISWHEQPKKQIYSFVDPKGYLTRPEMSNFKGSHAKEYQQFLSELKR